jgi:hypothetical protein
MSNIKVYLSKSAIEAHSMQWKKKLSKVFLIVLVLEHSS